MTKTKLAALALALTTGLCNLASAYAQDAAPAAEQAAAPSTAPNWLVTCSNQMDAAKLSCSMSQSVVLAANGARLMTAVVEPTDAGQELTLVLPFGLDLQAGVQLVIDQADWQKLPVTTCEAGACYSSTALEEDALARLSKGNALDVKLINRQGEEVVLSLTLAGFTGSLELMN